MGSRSTISILGVLISVVAIASALRVEAAQRPLLRDGFVLSAVDGKLTRQDSNETPDRWFFEPDANVSNGIVQVGAGTSLELLPSSTLEKMTIDAAQRAEDSYKLWGKVTKYKGSNFIFPIYFLALSKTSKSEPSTPQETQEKQEAKPVTAPNEPPQAAAPNESVPKETLPAPSDKTQPSPAIFDANDALPIPQGIIEKLKGRPAATVKRTDTEPTKEPVAKLPKRPRIRRHCILANRTGFLHKQVEGLPVFGFDALGRNIEPAPLCLLPCEALERTEQEQSEDLEPVRLKIAGIVTEYKGKKYLLLERAVRVYSHENFGR